MNRIHGILKTTSQWLEEINQGLTEDVRKSVIRQRTQMQLGMINDLFGATIKEERGKIGDCLADEGGAKVFTEYIRLLTNNGQKDPRPGTENAKTLTILTSSCWNYSDVSLNFALELGKAGLFVILVAHLQRCKGSLQAMVKKEEEFVLPSLSILHNCAKEDRNRPYFKEAKAVAALLPYAKMKNETLIFSKMVAILALSYLVEEEGQNEMAVDNAMIYVIVFFLEKAVSSSGHTYNGFSVTELVDGLKHLANCEHNKAPILNAGILPLLDNLLETGDLPEKILAAATLWSLSFDKENKDKMQKDGEMISKLEKLAKQPGELGHLTSGALWLLKDQGNGSPSLQSGASRRTRGGDQVDSSTPREKHLMISYAPRDKILALKVKAQLERFDYRVWMDMDCAKGTNFEATKKALQNSEAFLFCASHEYKTRPSCRMGAELALRMKIPTIPLLVEPGYSSSGWLGAMQGSTACFDFSDPATFQIVFATLRKELGNKGKLSSAEKVAKNSASAEVSLEMPVEKWTKKQVTNWATANNLAPKLFLDVDGEALAYLREMKKSSPEFYHKYVVEKLEISTLQDMTNLSRGLENLKL